MPQGDIKLREGIERRLKAGTPKQLRRSAKTLQEHADEAARWWPALSASFAADAARLLARAKELETCISAKPTTTPAGPPSAGTVSRT